MAYRSKGTSIQLKMGSPLEFVDLPQVNNINVTQTQPTIDATHLQSTAKEYLTDFSEGSVTCEINYLPDNAVNQELEDAYDDGVERLFQVIYPQGASTVTKSFSALIDNLGAVAAVGAKLSRSVQLKVSGAIVRS